MGTTTLLNLDQELLQTIGDWKQHAVTTAIAASNAIVSTNLRQYRSTVDYFTGYWVYIDTLANIGVSRYVTSDDGTDTLAVLGTALASDVAALATFRISRFSWADRMLALNQAITEVYPNVKIDVDNRALVVGNVLPDNSFEDWISTSNLTWYSTTNTVVAQTSTAGLRRGVTSSYSVKSTASAANGYFYISSDSYPRLLDLAGKDVDFRAWAYPEVANDASLVIYTIKADGTIQTLTSTTTNPAGKFSLIELEDQTINEDITKIEFRFKTATNAKYVYWDSVFAGGMPISEYLIPSSISSGGISQVYIQTSANRDNPEDDLNPYSWRAIYNWNITSDGTSNYLELPYNLSEGYRIRLVGSRPLETVSVGTSTISTSDKRYLQLLSCYAAYRLYTNAASQASGSDRDKYNTEAGRFMRNYLNLSHTRMSQKPVQLRTGY